MAKLRDLELRNLWEVDPNMFSAQLAEQDKIKCCCEVGFPTVINANLCSAHKVANNFLEKFFEYQ